MRARDNFHSQLVAWAKIILPLCGIALLSTLFLFAGRAGNDPVVPLRDIAKIAQEQSIAEPRFSGVTDTGAIIQLSAGNARPDPDTPARVVADTPALSLARPGGVRIDITSGRSLIDTDARTALFDGLVRLTTSTGYRMETSGLLANMGDGTITSDGALEVQAPYGSLTAGRIRIETTADGQGQRMLFTQGVRLLYSPQN